MVFISRKIAHNRPPIAVDFDGVIHAYSKGFADGTIYDGPVSGVAQAMGKLKNKYYVYINSQRNATEEGRKAVEEFLLKYQIPFDEISEAKPPAKFYIDDRAVRFRDWGQTIKDVEYFEKELEKIKK